MKPIVLIACFSPLAAIWIVMKVAVWFSAVNDERKYVRAESKKPHGPYVADAYADAQTIDEALYQYYTVENNLPVPNWRQIKDPDWWIQYLKDMGLDPRNR